MKHLTRYTRSVFFGLVLVFSAHARAGLPVIDVANLVQAVQQVFSWIQQATDMIETIQNLEEQVQLAEAELESMTGQRLLGLIFNDPNLRHYLPEEATEIYMALGGEGFSGLSDSARLLREARMLYNCEDESSDFLNLCEKTLSLTSQDIAFSRDAFALATERTAQIEALMNEINNTSDPKAIAELQARIDAEGVMIANEQSRIEIWQKMSSASHQANEQEMSEWYIDSMNRPSVLSGFAPTPNN